MRKFLFAIFIFSSYWSQSQTITGVVREKGTGLPLPYANVFINNSTFGAATNEKGEFEIKGEIPEEFELVASFVGYKTSSILIQRKGKQLYYQAFDLEFLEDQLSEVELKAKRDRSWERNLKLFTDVFLAVPDDPYGRDIELLNPWVLEFEKVKPEKGFNYTQATADLPLKIVNKAMGYQIDFYLQDFRMLRNASRFFGQAYYQELEPEDPETDSLWKVNKELNYKNSVRHLALSLLLRNPQSQGFELYLVKPETGFRARTNNFSVEVGESIIPLEIDSLYSKPLGNGSYRIFLPGKIEVHHLNKPWRNDYYSEIYHAISWLIAPSGYFDVDRNGTLIHPAQLVLSGYIGRQRLARSLPLDFVPDESFADFKEELEALQSRYLKLDKMREKPWLTLNKPFYYPGETLWLGGKMLYQNPPLQDSLSRIIYIDLLNSKLETIRQDRFPIVDGRISGGIELSDTLSKGDYLLRAYTRWGLNFLEKDIIQLPFPILSTNELLENSELEEEVLFGDILIKSNSSLQDSINYQLLDLELSFLDAFENPVEAQVILSATEGSIPVELDSKYRLENAMDWLDDNLPETFDSQLPNSIDYGISVYGRFFPFKKKGPLAEKITLVLGDLEDYGRVNSDSSGRFWATGLNFQDSSQIAIAALDEKLKPLGRIELIPFQSPIFRGSFPKQKYSTQRVPEEQESFLDISGDYIQLDEFIKEGEINLEPSAERNYGYGEPNQEVGPNDLESKTMAEILGLLRFNINTLKFRNYTFGETTGSPLLIIDGRQFSFLEPQAFREILLGFEPSQLKSIKVYNDNISNVIFGLAGYAGVIMIETKNGYRREAESEQKFNPESFQIFPIKGFSTFPEFPTSPPQDQYLSKKATIYWDPLAETEEGSLKIKIPVPYGIKKINLRVEGVTEDGEAFYRVLGFDIK
ncbi:carboxypeptidase-like regulatory domain-containing protein [Algoriphagus limi]|uniref:Carboxypeptidase-like regulatory domain-containing protein n=1 Tax=Algoriphagus limi TaxID=2975273 RepID=A0ABT2G3J5_9BACT|nr:carboxypeptidase-like regulatory domain-containing protein [Algoriphagus limi]MCS5489051.1 carboxypeptidase-like regulatory domain-containing protein [Algoriphagus limi]